MTPPASGGEREAARLRRLNLFSAALGVQALVMLVLRAGFPELPIPHALVVLWSGLLPLGLFMDGLLRLLWVRDPWLYLSLHPLRYLILGAILLELSGVAFWTQAGSDLQEVSYLAGEVYLAIFLLGFSAGWAKGAVTANRWLANRRIPVLVLPPITFAVAIALGGAALCLPGLHRTSVPALDHLFTSTSALCVTGLAVYDISATLNPLGLAVLALLIQIGGLGTLTVLGMLALWQRGDITLGERVALSELVGGSHLDETRRLIGRIVRITVLVEAAGAVALWFFWRDLRAHPLLEAAFHSVSAFCNAGFSLWPDSFARFRGEPGILLTLLFLIVAGGLGFHVLSNLGFMAAGRLPWGPPAAALSRASKLALAWSGALLAAGTLFYLLDARQTGVGRTLLDAFFQSATTRTAGFQLEGQRGLGGLGYALTLGLMIVGASAQSTGGGIKIPVAARLFQRLDSAPRRQSIATASYLVLFYLGTGALGAELLRWTEGLTARDAMFEAFSALGTVGLTRDVTPELGPAGKAVDMLLMFTGRVLYPVLAIGWLRARRVGAGAVPWT